MCATMLSTGARRGAMMATLRCDHPDIETFVDASAIPPRCGIQTCRCWWSDAFMAAVATTATAACVSRFHRAHGEGARPVAAHPARGLRHAEPGVLFIDTINRNNTLADRETLTATILR